MESIKFWYRFDDEEKAMSGKDVDITVENENGVKLDEVMEGFESFLTACGFSVKKAAEYVMNWE